MKLRYFLVALALAVLTLFSGCNILNSEDQFNNNTVSELEHTNVAQPVSDYGLENVDVKDAHNVSFSYAGSSEFSVSDIYSKAELKQGYNSLTLNGQRKCYEEMLENSYYISNKAEDGMYDVLEIHLNGITLTEAQIRQVIVAFTLDNPHVFWLDNKFGYYNSAGFTILQLYSFLGAEDVKLYTSRLNKQLEGFHAQLNEQMTEYSRELYAHDWLVNQCGYSNGVSKISDDFLSFTSYGAIVNKSAVCEGYARALQLLLASVGIESLPIVGNGNDGLHMWNSVKINDEWYYVDSTWNDNESGTGYDYFNITSEQLLYDHTIMPVFSQLTDAQVCGNDDGVADSFNIMVPVCTALTQNYYVKNSAPVNGINSISMENIKAKLVSAQEKQADFITLLVGEKFDYDETLDELFYTGEYVFFQCLDMVNEELSENYIDRNNVSISKKPNLRVVIVYLQYTDEV